MVAHELAYSACGLCRQVFLVQSWTEVAHGPVYSACGLCRQVFLVQSWTEVAHGPAYSACGLCRQVFLVQSWTEVAHGLAYSVCGLCRQVDFSAVFAVCVLCLSLSTVVFSGSSDCSLVAMDLEAGEVIHTVQYTVPVASVDRCSLYRAGLR
jgi:cytidine deaminase